MTATGWNMEMDVDDQTEGHLRAWYTLHLDTHSLWKRVWKKEKDTYTKTHAEREWKSERQRESEREKVRLLMGWTQPRYRHWCKSCVIWSYLQKYKKSKAYGVVEVEKSHNQMSSPNKQHLGGKIHQTKIKISSRDKHWMSTCSTIRKLEIPLFRSWWEPRSW